MSLRLTEGEYFGSSHRTKENNFLKCSLTSYAPFTIIEKHYHENNYFSLLVSGSYGEVSNSNKSLVRTGEIIFRPAGYHHANDFPETGAVCFNIEMKRNWIQFTGSRFLLPDKPMLYKIGGISAFYKLFYQYQNNLNEDVVNEILTDCLINNERSFKKSFASYWVERVKTILNDETEIHHTLHSLAERVHVHPVHLARGFKNKTGITIGEYQLKTKTQAAFSLLITTSKPVNEIAFEAGFYDAAHFIRSFRKLYQTTPQKLRSVFKS